MCAGNMRIPYVCLGEEEDEEDEEEGEEEGEGEEEEGGVGEAIAMYRIFNPG